MEAGLDWRRKHGVGDETKEHFIWVEHRLRAQLVSRIGSLMLCRLDCLWRLPSKGIVEPCGVGVMTDWKMIGASGDALVGQGLGAEPGGTLDLEDDDYHRR